MTVLEFSSDPGLQPPILRCTVLSGWSPRYRVAGQFWPSSCAFQMSYDPPQECNPSQPWWSHGHAIIQPDSCHQSAWVEPQTRGQPCLGNRRPVPYFCTSFGHFWQLPHPCLNRSDNTQRLTPDLSWPCSLWVCLSQMKLHCCWHYSDCPDPWCS